MTSLSWSYSGAPTALSRADAAAILVDGSTFCVATAAGDIPAAGPYGLFFRDVRSLSRWELRVDGYAVEPLTGDRPHPYTATYVGRVPPPPGLADSHLLVLRTRTLGDGMSERIVVRNLGAETAACEVTLLVEADFSHVFEVKENRVVAHPERVTAVPAADATGMHFAYRWRGHSRDVHITADTSGVHTAGALTFAVTIPARSEWATCLEVRLAVDGTAVALTRPLATNGDDPPPRRRNVPHVEVTSAATELVRILQVAQHDVHALRLPDPESPEHEVVAAGAPWFMTLFGRDSLLTAWMTLPFAPELAAGTLHTLARLQGREVDPVSEEQPGRIPHELRVGGPPASTFSGRYAYYGTADATPLFVMLVAEAQAWGLSDESVDALLPHVDAALDWISAYGDRDGDGFVEYQRATDMGLVNQGWKDSFDGVNDAAGRLASPPIALCEVQGYVYAAYRARARLAEVRGDHAAVAVWNDRAGTLKAAFNEAFWLPDRGYFAVALDADKRPVDALASNLGHCLWTGIVADELAAHVTESLLSPAMFSGWGIRTLAASMGAFNPLSYHNGSVWPHDNALAAAGLMRYGCVEGAQRVATAVFDVAVEFGYRLPELFSGFDRDEFASPVPYPTSCSPQAWAAAAPLSLVWTLLRPQPGQSPGEVVFDPAVPDRFLPLTLSGLRIGPRRVRLEVEQNACRVTDL